MSNLVLGGGSAAADAYTIDQSLRFDEASSSKLSREQSAGNRKTWTFSCWFKRGNLATSAGADRPGLMGVPEVSGVILGDGFRFVNDSDILQFMIAGGTYSVKTTQAFRDTGAWYHFVLAVDTTQDVAANRIKFYVNGTQITDLQIAAYPAEDSEGDMCNTQAHYIGRYGNSATYWLDAYQAEMHFIDGTALTPSSFGETNDEGVWVPKKYTGGSYGTTGFYLDFADSSDLGDDESGQGNDWAESNLDAADQRTDTPTNNQVTFNPLNNQRTGGTLTEGNTVYSGPSTRTLVSLTANIPSTGKWAVAFSTNDVSTANGWNFGITKSNNSNFGDASGSNEDVGASDGINMNPSSSTLYLYDYVNSSSIEPGQAITTSDEFWLAVDMATGKCFLGIYDASATAMVWVAADAGLDGNPATGANPSVTISDMIGSTEYTFAVAAKSPDLTLIKSADLDGTTPSGYTYFENISDFPEPALKDGSTNFQAVTYSGTGSSNAITFGGNADMQPDAVLLKQRNSTRVWTIYDAARGVHKYVQTNEADAESDSSLSLTAFGSDGFTVGSGAWVNVSGGTFVGYGWSAGNSGASNEAGGINTTTTYSDATAGISVSTYEGTGSASTIGHGLGVAPKLIMVKNRDAADAWKVYHAGVASDPQTDYLVLNTNAAAVDDATVWNDTAPTSTVFSIGTHTDVNTSGESYVAYAFAEVAGFSKFSVFTGNANADGPFIDTGFKPAWVMLKRTDSSDNWVICDNKRSTYNPAALRIYPDTNNADISSTTLDFISSGFKMRASDGGVNGSGGTYVVAAFAESPFGGDGASPTTAK